MHKYIQYTYTSVYYRYMHVYVYAFQRYENALLFLWTRYVIERFTSILSVTKL